MPDAASSLDSSHAQHAGKPAIANTIQVAITTWMVWIPVPIVFHLLLMRWIGE
jgi:hypothetical protein